MSLDENYRYFLQCMNHVTSFLEKSENALVIGSDIGPFIEYCYSQKINKIFIVEEDNDMMSRLIKTSIRLKNESETNSIFINGCLSKTWWNGDGAIGESAQNVMKKFFSPSGHIIFDTILCNGIMRDNLSTCFRDEDSFKNFVLNLTLYNKNKIIFVFYDGSEFIKNPDSYFGNMITIKKLFNYEEREECAIMPDLIIKYFHQYGYNVIKNESFDEIFKSDFDLISEKNRMKTIRLLVLEKN